MAKGKGARPISAQEVQRMMNSLRTLARQKTKQNRPDIGPIARNRNGIRVASDCAGLGSDIIALAVLGLLPKVESVWWSDNSPEKQELYQCVCKELGHSPGTLQKI